MAETKGQGAKPARPARDPLTDGPDPDFELPPEARPFISEGVRLEVLATGRAIDPATGLVITTAHLSKEQREARRA